MNAMKERRGMYFAVSMDDDHSADNGSSATEKVASKTILQRWKDLRSDIPDVLQRITQSGSHEEIVELLEEAASTYKDDFNKFQANKRPPETPEIQRVRIFLEAAHFAAEWGDLKHADLAIYLVNEAVARLKESPMKAGELDLAVRRVLKTAEGVGLSTSEGEDFFEQILGR